MLKATRSALPLSLCLAIAFASLLPAQTGIISTVAGTGVFGTSGTGGPAVNAQLGNVQSIAVDSSDNVYIADATNYRVVRIDGATGVLTLVAGTGAASSAGDGGPASQASLNYPTGVAVDSAGNLYIAERSGNRIRRVDAQTGLITTYAGMGTAAFAGDGGLAVAASLNFPGYIALDAAGNLYIADMLNARIRRVDAQTGMITTVAGNGMSSSSPDGVTAAISSINYPIGIGVDHSGNIYFAEYMPGNLRRINSSTGILGTVAGTGSQTYNGDGIAGTSAAVGVASGNATVDASGNVFFADGFGRVRRVDAASGQILTVAGNGSGPHGQAASGGGGGPGCSSIAIGDNGPASNATLDGPVAVALTSNGYLLLSDWLDCRIRRVALPSPYPYTNTTLAANPNQPVSLTATVTSIGNSGVPSGTVQFVDQPQFLGPTVLGSAPVINGTATLQVTTLAVGSSHSISAYYSGDAANNGSGSAAVAVTVTQSQKANPIVTVSASQTSTYPNALDIFTIYVNPPSGNPNQPTGTVQLYDGSNLVGTGTLGTLAPNYTQINAQFSTSGVHQITAVYLGDSNFKQLASAILNVTVLAASGVTLSQSPTGPTLIGQPITYTATVSPAAATGTIQLIDSNTSPATVLGTASLVSGGAVFTISTLSAGTHQIFASYGGDATYMASSSNALTQFVQSPTTVALTSDGSPSNYGQNVTLTATVSSTAARGSIQFFDGSTLLGSNTVSNGVARWAGIINGGSRSLTAAYQGDGTYLPSTSPVFTQVVNKVTPTVQIAGNGPIYINTQPLVLTVAVNPSSNGAAVQFLDGQTVIGTGTVNFGQAVFHADSYAAGVHTFTAVCVGDNNLNQATSPPLTITVQSYTTTTVTSQAPSLPYGQPAILTATINSTAATGTVQFVEGGTPIGTVPVSNGIAVLNIPAPSVGNHPYMATYNGDNVYIGSQSSFWLQTIVKASASATLASTPNPSVLGQAVTLATSISPAGSTGTVQFLDGATALGTATLASGAASITTSALAAGSHSITAVYSGDGNYNSVTSAAVNQIVKAPSTTSVTSNVNPSVVNATVLLIGTVSPLTATGTIQFLDGAAVLGTATITGGSATLNVSNFGFGTHVITAIYSGDASFTGSTSAAYSQSMLLQTNMTLLANNSDNLSSVYGQSITLQAWVNPAAATGTVQFLDGTNPIGDPVTLNNGAVTLPVSTLAVGTHQLKAQYSGDAVYFWSVPNNPVTVTITKASVAVGLVSTPAPSVAGQAVTFTASVSPATATGTIQFLDGTTVLGASPVNNGTASLSTSLSAGSHSITATYSGDANYNGASANLAQMVLATTSTVLSASTTSPAAGQPVTLTASVSPSTAGGTMQFLDGAATLGSVTISGGAAAITISTLAAGAHNLTAVYSGDSADAGSTSAPIVVTVVKASSSVVVASSLNPSVAGQSVTFTAAVSPSSASGTVQFADGATVLGTATLSGGGASLTTTALAAGSHTITATYSADAAYNGASGSVAQTVKASSSTTLSASSTAPTVGQAVTLTAAVSPSSATGTVQFLDGATVLGTSSVSGGAASLSVSTLSAGAHTLTAVYSGDSGDASSTSNTVTVTVSKTTATIGISSSLNPSVTGQGVTFTATVSPSSATGTVQFLDGATVLGAASVSGGAANLTTSALAAGVHTITASYSGDGSDTTAAASLSQTVKANSSTTLSASTGTPVYGQAVVLTAAVSPSFASGSVQFLDGSTVLGTASVSGGAAALSISSLAVGSHSLTAVYSGDSTDTSSSSSAVVVTVSKITAAVALSSSGSPSVAGQTVTFTATVSPANASGTVQFRDGSTVVGTVTLSGGAAAFSLSNLGAGSHTMTAVYSGDANDTAATSAVVNQTVVVGPPSNLAAASASTSQINLSWTASATPGAVYNVYSSTTPGFTPSAGNRIATGVSGTAYSHTGLQQSSTHYYVITAVSGGAESAASSQASATTNAPNLSCQVGYSVTTQWNNGFGTAITIKNTGNKPINGWNLTWTWPGNQQIYQSWSANYSQNGAQAALTNMSYNAAIAAGATISGIGFNASYSGSNPTPTAFFVNGVQCH